MAVVAALESLLMALRLVPAGHGRGAPVGTLLVLSPVRVPLSVAAAVALRRAPPFSAPPSSRPRPAAAIAAAGPPAR